MDKNNPTAGGGAPRSAEELKDIRFLIFYSKLVGFFIALFLMISYFNYRIDLAIFLRNNRPIFLVYSIISGGGFAFFFSRFVTRNWIIHKSERKSILLNWNLVWPLIIVPVVIVITEIVIQVNPGNGGLD